ncbi:MAG: LiaF transmembrane domain-containing protein [Terracidiphilus sp.]
MNRYLMIRRLRWPAFLLLVGVIALLAQFDILTWGQSWPLFLIVLGVLLLAERAALAVEGYPPYPGTAWQGTSPAASQDVLRRGAWQETSQPGPQPASTTVVSSEPQPQGDDRSGVQS